jgi:hypothetical protein
MEALQEVTDWGNGAKNNIYLLDSMSLVAYIPFTTGKPFYFKNPIRNFDKRGRKFVKADLKLFKQAPKTTRIEVKGSKGDTYYIDPEAKTCTCSGFGFRGTCKHIKSI